MYGRASLLLGTKFKSSHKQIPNDIKKVIIPVKTEPRARAHLHLIKSIFPVKIQPKKKAMARAKNRLIRWGYLKFTSRKQVQDAGKNGCIFFHKMKNESFAQ